MTSALAGGIPMIRLALRRDRLMLPWWLIATGGLVASTVAAFQQLYPEPAGRKQFGATVDVNPTFRALAGRIYDATTNGGLTAWRAVSLAVVVLGLMSITVVVRHTRQEEESGRLELLGATAVGRRTPLFAALFVAIAANIVAAIMIIAVLTAAGQDPGSSAALGIAVGAGGAVFAGVAAVTAQIFPSGRGATGAGLGILGAAFVLRALGDSDNTLSWLSWLSPIGWAQQVRPFAGDRWTVVALMVAVTVLLSAAAAWLNERRDLGAGLVPPRPGPGEAPERLAGPTALAWRLQRGPLTGWLIAFLVLGAAYGSATRGLDQLVESAPQFAEIFRQIGGAAALTDAFLNAILTLLSLIAAAYGIGALLRLRNEETTGRAELVLATAVGRFRYLAGHLGAALLGSAVLLAVAGVVTGAATDLVSGTSGHLGPVLRSVLAHVPAVWIVVGVVAVLVGWLPRYAEAGWAIFGGWAVLTFLGPSLQLPQAVLDLSPFSHVTGTDGFPVPAVLVLTAVAGALLLLGVAGFRRRDVG